MERCKTDESTLDGKSDSSMAVLHIDGAGQVKPSGVGAASVR